MIPPRPFLFFFFDNAKNLGRSDDAKRRKKRRMALCIVVFFARKFNISIQLFFKDFASRCYGDVMN